MLVGLMAPALLARAAAPAFADDPGQRRDQVHQKRAAVQAELKLALASDARVEAERNRLEALAGQERARLTSAQQAQDQAQAQTDAAARTLAAIEARAAAARERLSAQAVEAYVHGGTNRGFAALLEARSLDEASQRGVFVSVLQSHTNQALEVLRSARQDQAAAREELARARDVAAKRVEAVAARKRQFDAAERAAEVASAELAGRIATLREESRQYAAQEGQLESLIRSQQAAAAARAGTGSINGSTGFVAGQISNVGLIWPLHGPVSSEFGPRWGGFHPGIDIAAAYGTPIHAAKQGTVIFAGSYGGYGNFVVVDHGGGLATAYAHQSQIAVGQGQSVSQGQVIGYEGSTGYSTGPHLHFEVRINGSPQNPRAFESGGP